MKGMVYLILVCAIVFVTTLLGACYNLSHDGLIFSINDQRYVVKMRER